jgi:hypothetical protein
MPIEIDLERMPPQPTDWREVACHQQVVLAGLLICMQNRMIRDELREAVLLGAVQGQLEFITNTLGFEPNQVECVLQAINIQRGAMARGA